MKKIRCIAALTALFLVVPHALSDNKEAKSRPNPSSKNIAQDWIKQVNDARDKAVRLVGEAKALKPNSADLDVLERRYNNVRNTYVISASQAGSILRKNAKPDDPLILATAEQAKRTMVELRNWVNAFEARIKTPHDQEGFTSTTKHKSVLQVIANWMWDHREDLIKIVSDLKKGHADKVAADDAANEQLAKEADAAAKWPDFADIKAVHASD